jgi:small ligand-binding sensory domain FIST
VPFAAAISEHPLPTHAVGEVVGQVLERLGDRPDAALLFATGPFAGAMEDLAAVVRATLQPGALIAATTSAAIGGAQEVEASAAISLFAFVGAPGVGRRPTAVGLPATRPAEGWIGAIGPQLVDGATVVLLADPFSFPVDELLAEIGRSMPDVLVVGGLASAASGPGGNRLVADDRVVSDGAVALVLAPGTVVATSVVSQGCEPVGEPLVVTRAAGTLIEEIAGVPALDRLMAQAEEASPADRSRMARGLQLGIVVDERKAEFDRGDFLIRPVLGADRARKAVAVGAEVEVGTTVQFHVRDAEAADADLRDLLADAPGTAALVFSCHGRGSRLFGGGDHDAAIVHQHVEGGAVAGMACAGEIGPVGGRHQLHAMAASVLLLEDASG